MTTLVENPYVGAAVGGLLAGGATTLNLLMNGEITGFSGLINGAITSKPDRLYRYALLGSLIGTGSLLYATAPYFFKLQTAPPLTSAAYLFAGFCVGFGAIIGSGCTSGHGLCGIARFSPRSLIAVPTFMFTGFLTTTAASTVPFVHDLFFGPRGTEETSPIFVSLPHAQKAVAILSLAAVLLSLFWQNQIDMQDRIPLKPTNMPQVVSACFVGSIFALGMVVSGMINQAKVLEFLSPWHPSGWNPALMFVMGFGVCINIVGFSIARNWKKPANKPKFDIPTSREITTRLIVGSAIFGVGWGIAGICPAPGLINLAAGRLAHIIWTLGMCMGMFAANTVVRMML